MSYLTKSKQAIVAKPEIYSHEKKIMKYNKSTGLKEEGETINIYDEIQKEAEMNTVDLRLFEAKQSMINKNPNSEAYQEELKSKLTDRNELNQKDENGDYKPLDMRTAYETIASQNDKALEQQKQEALEQQQKIKKQVEKEAKQKTQEDIVNYLAKQKAKEELNKKSNEGENK